MFASQFGTNFDQSELKSQFVSVFPELVAPLPSMWKWSLIVHVLLQRKQPFFFHNLRSPLEMQAGWKCSCSCWVGVHAFHGCSLLGGSRKLLKCCSILDLITPSICEQMIKHTAQLFKMMFSGAKLYLFIQNSIC